jgi:hypothetical protein
MVAGAPPSQNLGGALNFFALMVHHDDHGAPSFHGNPSCLFWIVDVCGACHVERPVSPMPVARSMRPFGNPRQWAFGTGDPQDRSPSRSSHART